MERGRIREIVEPAFHNTMPEKRVEVRRKKEKRRSPEDEYEQQRDERLKELLLPPEQINYRST